MEPKELSTYYYKVKADSPLGEQLRQLLQRADEVGDASDALSVEMSCESYVPAMEADWGGIAGFLFGKNRVINKNDWTAVEVDIDNTELLAYSPNVRTKTIPMLEADALKYTGDGIVSERSCRFADVSYLYSRDEAAKLAGVALSTPPLDRLGKRHKLPRHMVNMLQRGIPAYQLLTGYPSEVINEVTRAQQESMKVMEKLSTLRFRTVMEVEGTKRAKEVFMKMLALPIVPLGTLNALLGISDRQFRAGLMEVDGCFYIVSRQPSADLELRGIEESEWIAAQEIHTATIKKPTGEC